MMKTSKRACFCWALVAFLALSLCGCQLARTDMPGEGEEQGRLAGAWVVFGLEGRNAAEEGRAAFTDPDAVTMFFRPVIKDDAVHFDQELSPFVTDVHIAVNSTDQREEYTFTGTVYTTHATALEFAFIPIYERKDGSRYADTGNKTSFIKADWYKGSKTALTLREEQSTKITGGEEKKEAVAIKVERIYIDALVSVRVLEFGGDYELRKETAVPAREEYTLQTKPETGLVLVEETYRNKEGEAYVTRTAYSRADAQTLEGTLTHQCNYPDERGVAMPAVLTLVF